MELYFITPNHNRLKQSGGRNFMFKEDYELWLINGKH